MSRDDVLARIARALSPLPPRDADLPRLLYGLGDGAPYTRDEVRRTFKLHSRVRVDVLEGRALRRLARAGTPKEQLDALAALLAEAR